MCFPKAPKEDPQVKIQQQEARTSELARLAEEKDKQLQSTKRTLRGSGVRSLISSSGAGFGKNYTA